MKPSNSWGPRVGNRASSPILLGPSQPSTFIPYWKMGALTPLHIIIIVHYSPVIKSIAKLKTYDVMYVYAMMHAVLRK
jgi:hypothetical protein